MTPISHIHKNQFQMDLRCIHFKNVGTYKVHYYAVCDNYQPVSGNVDVKINKAMLTVKAGSTEITYGLDSSGINSKLTALAENAEVTVIDNSTYKNINGYDWYRIIISDGRQAFIPSIYLK